MAKKDEKSAAVAPPAPVADPPAETTALAERSLTAAEKAAVRTAAAREETDAARAAVEAFRKVEPTSMMLFTPNSFKGAWELAGFLSDSGIVADGLRGNAGAVFSVMARGSLMGMHWSVAVTEAYVVKGRIGWPAAVMEALIDRSPTFEYFEVIEASAEKATVEAKKERWAEPCTYTVTIQEASAAGYLDPNSHYSKLWQTRPKLMLIAMARREAARMWAPGRFAGLYTPEELMAAARDALVKDAPSATASLEAFGDGPAALPAGEVEIVDPGAAQGPLAASSPPADDRVRLTADLLGKVWALLKSPPVIEEAALVAKLGAPLEEFSGNPGTKPADLYSQVLLVAKKLKQAAAR